MRVSKAAVLLTAFAVLAVAVMGSAQASSSPDMLEVSSQEQNVTAGETFDVDLLMTSTGGFYGDVEVESVNATLSYGDGVTAEEVRYGDWFQEAEEASRSHEIRPESREVVFEQSSESGDSGQWKRLATVEFSAKQGFEGEVDIEVSDVQVTLTNGQPAHVVTFDDEVDVKPVESRGLPQSGFVAALTLVSLLLVSLLRARS